MYNYKMTNLALSALMTPSIRLCFPNIHVPLPRPPTSDPDSHCPGHLPRSVSTSELQCRIPAALHISSAQDPVPPSQKAPPAITSPGQISGTPPILFHLQFDWVESHVNSSSLNITPGGFLLSIFSCFSILIFRLAGIFTSPICLFTKY